jgi:hypothetical protein
MVKELGKILWLVILKYLNDEAAHGELTCEGNVTHDKVTQRSCYGSKITLHNNTICGYSLAHDVELVHLLSNSDDN